MHGKSAFTATLAVSIAVMAARAQAVEPMQRRASLIDGDMIEIAGKRIRNSSRAGLACTEVRR